jgi:hypothetical protein
MTVLRLDPDEQVGFLAVHLNNRRAAKTLIQAELGRRLKTHCKGYTLNINSAVDASALEQAITRNKIDKIKLRRTEAPDDPAVAQTTSWVDAGVAATLELTLTPKASRLKTDLLRRFVIRHDQTAWPQIIEYGDITFEEANVEVELDNGHKRTFNIEEPESGFTMTEDLTDLSPDSTDPDDGSVLAALVRVIDDTTT